MVFLNVFLLWRWTFWLPDDQQSMNHFKDIDKHMDFCWNIEWSQCTTYKNKYELIFHNLIYHTSQTLVNFVFTQTCPHLYCWQILSINGHELRSRVHSDEELHQNYSEKYLKGDITLEPIVEFISYGNRLCVVIICDAMFIYVYVWHLCCNGLDRVELWQQTPDILHWVRLTWKINWNSQI